MKNGIFIFRKSHLWKNIDVNKIQFGTHIGSGKFIVVATIRKVPVKKRRLGGDRFSECEVPKWRETGTKASDIAH